MSGTRVKTTVSTTIAIVASAMLCQPATTAVITAVDATFPAGPDVMTVNANAGTHANRGVNGTRQNRQTFTVRDTVTVGTIYLAANNYNNQAFTLTFFSVDAVNATSGTNSIATPGPTIGSTITVDPFGSTFSGDSNLRIDLAPSEQFTLVGVTGTAGYGVTIRLPSGATTVAFNLVHSNTGSDIYSGGRFRRDDGDTTNTRDVGLALVAAVVPEPTSVGLLTMGALAALRRCRRRLAE